MVAGQAVDIAYEGQKGSRRIVNYIHLNKTSALIRASVLTGAFVGRANSAQAKALRVFGESLAWHFRSEMISSMQKGTEAEVGKKLRKDTDKQTYVKHYGIAVSKGRIDELIRRAEEVLSCFGRKSDMLVQIARFVGQRTF